MQFKHLFPFFLGLQVSACIPSIEPVQPIRVCDPVCGFADTSDRTGRMGHVNCGILPNSVFLRHASFFIAHKNCIFYGASCQLIKNLITLNHEKLQGVSWKPPTTLSHPNIYVANSGQGGSRKQSHAQEQGRELALAYM